MQSLSNKVWRLLVSLHENQVREPLLPSEAVAAGNEVEALLRAEALERKRAGAKLEPGIGGKTRDKVGELVGMSATSLDHARQVVDAAAADPDRYQPLLDEMDRFRNIDRVYRKLQQRRDEDKLFQVEPVVGLHRAIVIDCPWDYDKLAVASYVRPPYAVMGEEELAKLPVASWAAKDCHLFVWATNNFVPTAARLIEAWGFEFKTMITWAKTTKSGSMRTCGLGTYFRSVTEHCLFATKGRLPLRDKTVRTLLEAPRGRHSEKPEAFYHIVERVSYPPYLDAFARRKRPGWSVYGNID